jgi:CubicO group peptidase (beta-lactamase class C family)
MPHLESLNQNAQKHLRAALLGALALGVCGAMAQAPAPDKFEGVRQTIREGLAKENIPSIAVAVAHRGRIIWEEGFGWADRERGIPATEHTLYAVASISKPLTATGLMTLVHDGKINLDRPANDYLGDVKLVARVGDASQATIRALANHTSGLSRHYQYFYEGDSYPPPSPDQTVARYGNLITAPGEKLVYSNLGYGTLSYIIARVSGMTFPEYMRAKVFLPLGMSRSTFDPGPAFAGVAVRYELPAGRIVPHLIVDYPGGAGAYSTAHDLVRFGMFHLKDHLGEQQPILSDFLLDEMKRATSRARPSGGYGIGWFAEDDRPVVLHGGYMPGVSSLLLLVPREDIAIVVLGNCDCGEQQSLHNQVIDEVLKLLAPSITRSAAPGAPVRSAPKAFDGSPKLTGTWKGIIHTYTEDLPLTVEFLPTGEFARARLGDQPATALFNILFNPEDNEFDASLHGELHTPDANRVRPYLLRLSLKLRGDVLNGGARISNYQTRRGHSLTHWVELTRQPAAAL